MGGNVPAWRADLLLAAMPALQYRASTCRCEQSCEERVSQAADDVSRLIVIT